jgi:pimeloyl-ACP methyl ester carboxylesterase
MEAHPDINSSTTSAGWQRAVRWWPVGTSSSAASGLSRHSVAPVEHRYQIGASDTEVPADPWDDRFLVGPADDNSVKRAAADGGSTSAAARRGPAFTDRARAAQSLEARDRAASIASAGHPSARNIQVFNRIAYLSAPASAGAAAHSPAAACVLLFLMLGVALQARAAGEVIREAVFSDYTELSSNPELVRRSLSPLAAARLERELAQTGKKMATQPVDLAQERFLVYVPSQPPAHGYGLMVFIPPWQDARLPRGWEAVLDEFGVIFVTAARSGNDENVPGRREPLALLAAHNLIKRYSVDSAHVYVAGFSGGSRVALRLALAYPDLFRGALLNAGSDPVGGPELPLPRADLLLKLQSSTQLVYVTGELDAARAIDDLQSVHSMRRWCVFNVDHFLEPRVPHQVATAAALKRALGELIRGAEPNAVKLATCRSALEAELAAKLRSVESLIEEGKIPKARKRLQDVDEQFGGLAAPRSLELASKL